MGIYLIKYEPVKISLKLHLSNDGEHGASALVSVVWMSERGFWASFEEAREIRVVSVREWTSVRAIGVF